MGGCPLAAVRDLLICSLDSSMLKGMWGLSKATDTDADVQG